MAKKDTELKDDAMRDSVTGAAAGTAAALITNPVSQVSNMKASHPERFGNLKWHQVAKELYKTPSYSKDQKVIVKDINKLKDALHADEGIEAAGGLMHERGLKLKTLEDTLARTNPKNMGVRAFYSGFSTKALNNALFSAAMFGSIGMFKHMYDKAKDKKINVSVVNETNG